MKSAKRGIWIVTGLVVVVAMLFAATGVSFAQGPDGGRGGRGPRDGRQAPLVRIVIATAAESVDMDIRELLESAVMGQSLSDVITANGGDPAQVAADAKVKAETGIDEALENGRIDEERAAELKAELDTRIAEILAHEVGDRILDARVNFGLRRIVMNVVTESTGLDPQDVRQELQDGKSYATIITENGGDVAAVKAQIIADATENINEAVADGKMSQEDADTLLGELDAHVEELLNFTRLSV